MASGTCTVSGANVAAGFLNTWFTGATMSPAFPTNWAFALDTGIATTAGLVFEVSSGNSYAEVTVTRSTAVFGTVSGTGNSITNSAAAITFPTATGPWTGNAGANTTIQSGVIKDSTTIGSGNQWWFGLLSNPVTISNNQQLTFPTSNFTIQLS